MRITEKMAEDFTEIEPHKFVVDASCLGLFPGQWPSQIKTDMGNRMPFLRGNVERDESGGIALIKYAQANGCIDLTILND